MLPSSTTFAVATITWARSINEGDRIAPSLTVLGRLGLPFAVADRGTGAAFTEALRRLPAAYLAAPRQELASQVQATFELAAGFGTPCILYVEADKEDFIANRLSSFLRRAAVDAEIGTVLASRSAAAFDTCPLMQRYARAYALWWHRRCAGRLLLRPVRHASRPAAAHRRDDPGAWLGLAHVHVCRCPSTGRSRHARDRRPLLSERSTCGRRHGAGAPIAAAERQPDGTPTSTWATWRSCPNVFGHHLRIAADAFIPIDSELIPTGDIFNVVATPFDFRQGTALGARLRTKDEQLRLASGLDHTCVLPPVSGRFAPVAERYEPLCGRRLGIATPESGLHVYPGQLLAGGGHSASGQALDPHAAVCLETQHCPDSANRLQFPSVVIRSRQHYESLTMWRFTAN